MKTVTPDSMQHVQMMKELWVISQTKPGNPDPERINSTTQIVLTPACHQNPHGVLILLAVLGSVGQSSGPQ